MTIIAIDPGDTTGYCVLDDKGETQEIGKIKGHDDFLDWLEDQPTPDTIVIEHYKIRPGVGHNFSSVLTLQLIGAIRRYARKSKVTFIEQSPNDMYMGLKYLGLYTVYRGGKTRPHVPDDVSALAHATYYAVKTGIKPHRLDKNGSEHTGN